MIERLPIDHAVDLATSWSDGPLPRERRDPKFQLLFFSASPTTTAVIHTRRPLWSLLALIWLALGMSVPASAWTAHEAAHGMAQVSLDAHHHHDDGGQISVHDHDDGDTPDGGHDHMPSILLGAVIVPDMGVSLVVPEMGRMAFVLPVTSGTQRHATNALRRPPKLG